MTSASRRPASARARRSRVVGGASRAGPSSDGEPPSASTTASASRSVS
jgi:hypothetical protein